MYRFTLLFCFLLLLGSVRGQDKWITFHPIENDFEIEFPDIPETKEKDLHTEIGVLKTVSYNVKQDKKSDNFLYSVNLVVYPDLTFHEDSTEYNKLVLQNSVEELSRLLKCEIVYSTESTVSDLPSISFRLMDEMSGQVVKGCAVRNHNTVYTATVFTMKDRSLNADIDRFLNSFLLLD
jgi:hypothetical protein